MSLALRYPQADVAPDQVRCQSLLILLEQSIKEWSVGVITRKTGKGSMGINTIVPASSFPTAPVRPCQAKHVLLSLSNKLFSLLHGSFPSLRVSVQAAKGFRSGCPDLVPFCHDLLCFLPITPGLFIDQLAIALLNGMWFRVVNAQGHDLRDLEPYLGEQFCLIQGR
jgi:hypothetical protein